MTVFVEICVNVPAIRETFHYHLPPDLEGQVGIGSLVVVPFGRQMVQGVILDWVERPEVPKTKAVSGVIDTAPVMTISQIELAKVLAVENLGALSEYIRLMLPPGLSQMADTQYELTAYGGQVDLAEVELSEAQTRLISLLRERGALRGRQISAALPRKRWKSTTQALVRKGILISQPVLRPPAVRPKMQYFAKPLVSPQVAQLAMDNLARAGSAALSRRQKMLQYVLAQSDATPVSQIYAECNGTLADLRVMAQKGLLLLEQGEVVRDPLQSLVFVPDQPPPLTSAQRTVWQEVRDTILETTSGSNPTPFLLHGVTGSGKTEIYLHAVAETLRLNRQAIVLVPEIALTPQTVQRFLARFPGKVGVVHSRLSPGERYDTWRRARAGELSVIVGPRSALFTPFRDVGLIVMDESHEDAYAQNDVPPYYHARYAAVAYARICSAVCLFGSATPDVATRYRAEKNVYHLLRLPARILAHQQAVQQQVERLGIPSQYQHSEGLAASADLPPVRLVDMRQELKTGNRSIFSRLLKSSLEEVLARGEQAILFLNRRGRATYIFCRDCGQALECPRCDLPLTAHGSQQILICHHCGYRRQTPRVCPSCGGTRIKQYGTGTERVEAEVQQMFPQVRTLRWDWETTRKKGAHGKILAQFANHQADILIGTQMLAKGLDLPWVTLVGVILADVGLHLPDYRATERAFQVLTQVAGRAGRSLLGGQVVLQTFLPDHYVIRAVAQHDYQGFYKHELDGRAQLRYPPFGQLVRLEYRHADPKIAEAQANQLAADIQGWAQEAQYRSLSMIGPAPCFFARINGKYRWQIVLRGSQPTQLLQGRILKNWRLEVNPVSLL